MKNSKMSLASIARENNVLSTPTEQTNAFLIRC